MTDSKKLTVTPEGEMTIKTDANGHVNMSSDQPVSMNLGKIESVGIEHLVDVAEHTINEQLGFVSHLVKFRDGGTVEFAYNSSGQIVTLRGHNVLTTVEAGTRVLFKMKPQTGN